jgi:hypothetical protein
LIYERNLADNEWQFPLMGIGQPDRSEAARLSRGPARSHHSRGAEIKHFERVQRHRCGKSAEKNRRRIAADLYNPADPASSVIVARYPEITPAPSGSHEDG